jgi:hypothetical protein
MCAARKKLNPFCNQSQLWNLLLPLLLLPLFLALFSEVPFLLLALLLASRTRT